MVMSVIVYQHPLMLNIKHRRNMKQITLLSQHSIGSRRQVCIVRYSTGRHQPALHGYRYNAPTKSSTQSVASSHVRGR